MNYKKFEKAISSSRLSRYLTACNGNKRKAIIFYRLNIRLSQSFFGLIGVFEITLRNAIDEHYKNTLSDIEWLWHSTSANGIFSDRVFARGRFATRKKIQDARRSLIKPYTHDRLVAALSFGFWVKLFDRIQYRVAGKTLHLVFQNRPTGTSQKAIYKTLCKLRDFRNRIAHHEPICFNIIHEKDLTYAKEHYELLIEMTQWLGYDPKMLYKKVNRVNKVLRRINRI